MDDAAHRSCTWLQVIGGVWEQWWVVGGSVVRSLRECGTKTKKGSAGRQSEAAGKQRHGNGEGSKKRRRRAEG